MWWDDENTQTVLSKTLCLHCYFCDERNNGKSRSGRSNCTEVSLITKSLHISKQQGDHPNMLGQVQSKHWHNPIESMEYLQSIFSIILHENKSPFRSLNINISVTLVLALLSKHSFMTDKWKERCQRHVSWCWKKEFVFPHLNCQLWAVRILKNPIQHYCP